MKSRVEEEINARIESFFCGLYIPFIALAGPEEILNSIRIGFVENLAHMLSQGRYKRLFFEEPEEATTLFSLKAAQNKVLVKIII